MSIPIWKKWLSYIYEVHIESAPSELNPHLYVSLRSGRLQLCTANAVYSHADLYGNFRKAFEHLNWDHFKGNEVLILGFGLGSIPFMLETIFKKAFRYTAVELDENVMYLAQKYVLPDLKSNFTFHLMNAEHFVYSNDKKWDLICMDVFVDDKIPDEMQSIEFCQALEQSLASEGILIYNRLSRNKADLKDTDQYFKETFLKVFPNGSYLDVQGNWMLTNDSKNYKSKTQISI